MPPGDRASHRPSRHDERRALGKSRAFPQAVIQPGLPHRSDADAGRGGRAQTRDAGVIEQVVGAFGRGARCYKTRSHIAARLMNGDTCAGSCLPDSVGVNHSRLRRRWRVHPSISTKSTAMLHMRLRGTRPLRARRRSDNAFAGTNTFHGIDINIHRLAQWRSDIVVSIIQARSRRSARSAGLGCMFRDLCCH